MARSESSPSFLALCNKCFFWSVLTGMITGKKPTQRRMKASKVMTVTKKSCNHTGKNRPKETFVTQSKERRRAFRSAFGVRRSAFGVRRSAFGVRRSAFGVRRSAFCIRRSAFGKLPLPRANSREKPYVS